MRGSLPLSPFEITLAAATTQPWILKEASVWSSFLSQPTLNSRLPQKLPIHQSKDWSFSWDPGQGFNLPQTLECSMAWVGLFFAFSGGHCVLRWHAYPRVEHQRQPYRECEHFHRPEPADCLLLRVGDERVGHTECHSDGTLRWCCSGKSAVRNTLGFLLPWFTWNLWSCPPLKDTWTGSDRFSKLSLWLKHLGHRVIRHGARQWLSLFFPLGRSVSATTTWHRVT